MSLKKSTIEIEIGLDGEKIPQSIEWKASDMKNSEKSQEAKAMMLGLFDKDTLDTLRFDIWTTEMQIIEMDRFVFQSLRALATVYHRATNNSPLANDMQKFAEYFGQKTEILKPEEPQDSNS